MTSTGPPVDGLGALPREITGASLVLELADGRTALVEIPRARWEMTGGIRHLDRDRRPVDNPLAVIAHGEEWFAFEFVPLALLPGEGHARCRVTYAEESGSRLGAEGTGGLGEVDPGAG